MNTSKFSSVLPLAVALSLAAGAEAFTSSAVGVALPRIAADFSASPDDISWTVTIYLTAYALALPLTSWLSDLLGQRLYLGISAALYAVASLGCSLAPSLTIFLFWRGLEGMAGAAFIARAIFTFTKELRPPMLTRALFIFMAGFSLKGLGLPFGGMLVDSASWRWLFVVPAVVMLGGAIPALMTSEEVWPRRKRGMSGVTAVGLLSVGLGALLVAVLRGERDEWFSSVSIIALLLVASTALAAFAWRQLKHHGDEIVLPMNVLRYPGMAVGVVLSFLAGVMMIGGLYVLPRFFVGIVHTDFYTAGWLLSLDAWSMIAGLAFAAWTLGKLMTRALLVLSGAAFVVAMLLFATRITAGTPVEALYLPVVLHGLAVGMALPPIGIFSFRAVGGNHADNGQGRAWHYTARQIGGAVAVALAVLVLDHRASVHSGRLAENLNTLNAGATHVFASVGRALASRGLMPVDAVPAAHLVVGHIVMREATVLAFRDLFFLTAFIGVAVIGLAFGLPRVRRPVRTAIAPSAAPSPTHQ